MPQLLWRKPNFAVSLSPVLLCYGDICCQLFENITAKAKPTWGVANNTDDDARQSAAEWWEKHKQDDPEQYYFNILLNDNLAYDYRIAIGRLLQTDTEKNLPTLLQLLLDGSEIEYKKHLYLRELEPFLTEKHVNLLKQLAGKNSPEIEITAAGILWAKFGNDYGVKLLTERMLDELMSGDNKQNLNNGL